MWLAQALMEAEVSAKIGAGLYERADDRLAYRNGSRPRRWDTRVGSIELKIPRIDRGSRFPQPGRVAPPRRYALGRAGRVGRGRSLLQPRVMNHIGRKEVASRASSLLR